MTKLALPPRYEPLVRLGEGGGGEVWSVRDRQTQQTYALKVLHEHASSHEMSALVREAVALSGLEGLGVPRVIRFGRLPNSSRAFMLRELVEGTSLEELMGHGANYERALDALVRAAERLTVLHRAGLLHGDIKPANIIVAASGAVTLVDLGLAAPWLEGGARPEGLTPRYAAPELFEGKPITVRAEVYALGVILSELIALGETGGMGVDQAQSLTSVATRATSNEASERYPSADEFASALRRSAGLSPHSVQASDRSVYWPIVGIDATSARLLKAVLSIKRGEALRVEGPPSSGKSALLRRLAWSLGIEGHALVWLDESSTLTLATLEAEIDAHGSPERLFVLVDDADALNEALAERLKAAESLCLVTVGGRAIAPDAAVFEVPPLDSHAAQELVRRAIPSLTDRVVKRLYDVAGGRPGELQRLVRLIAREAVAGEEDVERLLGSAKVVEALPEDPLARAVLYLDRGRFNEARAELEDASRLAHDRPVETAVARARLYLGLGEADRALTGLDMVKDAVAQAPPELQQRWSLYFARAKLGVGEYQESLSLLEAISPTDPTTNATALSYRGLALVLTGQHEAGIEVLKQAVQQAQRGKSAQIEGLALQSLAMALQRAERLDEARSTYEEALHAAERASDAGSLAQIQLNLAGMLSVGGNIAAAIEHLEGAVDMGRRSGRSSVERQATLILANTDLYLGRLARARASIEGLEQQQAQLSSVERAQLCGLRAMLCAVNGQTEEALRAYEECSNGYEELGRNVDAAEARLESVLVGSRARNPDVVSLKNQLSRGVALLGDTPEHRSLLLMARARVAALSGDDTQARAKLEEMLRAAKKASQKEWIWRGLEARAELEVADGQTQRAKRDREEALATLEDIGSRLPRDLREVYWNDPRRRQLRAAVEGTPSIAATEHIPFGASLASRAGRATGFSAGKSSTTSLSTLSATPLERRLARILEINSELAGELELERLTARVIDHAVDLLRAERGFLLLLDADHRLSVYTSRSRKGDAEHHDFSRSIAQRVVATREPIVSLSARDDARMSSYASVHQLMLQSVACVPILSPSGQAIGALYLETRLNPGAHFEQELPTLHAFAQQVAIALENARLVSENQRRAAELERTNQELASAQADLKELLGNRTRKLNQARRKLRDARQTLYSHFGYQGLVGTSAVMRRVYELVERVKDTDVPVLVTGESGTGKEVIARAIHQGSARSGKKFLGINCGAVPEQLLESELFGHMKGAFTGADRDRKGLFRECEGGSLLLDEIGETPPKMQATLLRVLQERKVRPVGGTQEVAVDARVIFATNKDLKALVEQRLFREDLYYRIVVVELRLPPLRERVEDIPQLVDHFLGLFAARYQRERRALTRDALRRLAAFSWPGNVRQLEHVLLNAWILSEKSEIDADDLDLPDRAGQETRPRSIAVAPMRKESQRSRQKATISQHRRDERERILQALQACNWNRVKAAELSGIPRRTFYRRMREYGIQ